MQSQSPVFTSWRHAMTLVERMTTLHETMVDVEMPPEDLARARRRLERWRSQEPFTTGDYFAPRLASDGMDENDLLYLLKEPIKALHERFTLTPAWVEQIERAFSRPSSIEMVPRLETFADKEVFFLLEGVKPLVNEARARLFSGIEEICQQYAQVPFDATVIEEALLSMPISPLLLMLGRTMVLELNIARLEDRLEGASSQDRFQSFVRLLQQPEMALKILEEYPVLARQLSICCNHWVDFSLEFLNRLCIDWQSIRETFCLPEQDPGMLIDISASAGDRHRGGKSVLVATFSSGFKLIYKPRALAIEIHFQELLVWLNERGEHPPFQTLNILDCNNYGWVGYVEAQTCTTPDELRRFYHRMGGYLALFYALEATDFHSENLIAAGEHPIPIDLEALFHPRLGTGLNSAHLSAMKAISSSVLRVMLLPYRVWGASQLESFDPSGMGSQEGQFSPFDIPVWKGSGTDEMQIIRERVVVDKNDNRPTLNGKVVPLLDYAESIIEGFTNIYQLLIKHRNELLSEHGCLSRFADDEVRVILRATQAYYAILRESFHPDVLRDALDRDRLFDRLWIPASFQPHVPRIIPAERQDLEVGDIPVFSTSPNSRDLWSSSGQRIPAFFDVSGLEVVRRHLQQFSQRDLEKQLWFIRASLSTLSTEMEQTKWKGYTLQASKTEAKHETFLQAARAVGDRLEHLAIRGDGDASWVGLTYPDGRHAVLAPLGVDFYDGLPGITLFLAYLGAITGEARYTKLSKAALMTLQSQVQSGPSFIQYIGGFCGWGGIIYSLVHLGVLWDQPDLLNQAEELVDFLPPLIEQDKELDLISGAAGCLMGLFNLYYCTGSQPALEAAQQCGDRIIAQALSIMPTGYQVSRVNGALMTSGFGHGAAGIACSLLELASASGEQRFAQAAHAVLSYERTLFVSEVDNWLDMRSRNNIEEALQGGISAFMDAWCHGAPGIGVGRLRSLRFLDNMAMRDDIHAALRTTLANGFGRNHSLCHGDLGNLEPLLLARETLDDSEWSGHVKRLASMILNSIDREGRVCGITLGVESPGLMTGIAGMGYQLLRLAEPVRVPSILVLAPPLGVDERIVPGISEISFVPVSP